MITQINSAKEVIARCKKLGVPVVLGGPIIEIGKESFPDVNHFLIGESENTLSDFIGDLKMGIAKRSYSPQNFPI